MNKSSEYDSKYVGYLLSVVFGEDILKVSSLQHTEPNVNDARLTPLDPMKLQYVESMHDHYY